MSPDSHDNPLRVGLDAHTLLRAAYDNGQVQGTFTYVDAGHITPGLRLENEPITWMAINGMDAGSAASVGAVSARIIMGGLRPMAVTSRVVTKETITRPA